MEHSEEVAQIEALLEEEDICPDQPTDPFGAIDSEIGRQSLSQRHGLRGRLCRSETGSLTLCTIGLAEEDIRVEALWTHLKCVGGIPPHTSNPETPERIPADGCRVLYRPRQGIGPDGLSHRLLSGGRLIYSERSIPT